MNQIGLASLRKSSIVLFSWHLAIGPLLWQVNVTIIIGKCILSSHRRRLRFNLGTIQPSFFRFSFSSSHCFLHRKSIMKKTSRRSKQTSPVHASSSEPNEKQIYEERIRSLETENKAYQVWHVPIKLLVIRSDLSDVCS